MGDFKIRWYEPSMYQNRGLVETLDDTSIRERIRAAQRELLKLGALEPQEPGEDTEAADAWYGYQELVTEIANLACLLEELRHFNHLRAAPEGTVLEWCFTTPEAFRSTDLYRTVERLYEHAEEGWWLLELPDGSPFDPEADLRDPEYFHQQT